MPRFKFDINDHNNDPKLFRLGLVPVFFKKGCLNKYFTEPEYKCSLNETYGTIDHDEFDIPFGINKNKRVIMWLCDVEKLPEEELGDEFLDKTEDELLKEQSYLYSFNINSDHDIESQFYDAQILKKFPDPIIEVEILMQKTKINKIFNKKFGFNLFKNTFQDDDIDEVLKQVEKYSKIIMNQKEHLESFSKDWNDTLIEDINKENLIEFLKSQNIETEKDGNKLGEVKLLEKLIQKEITEENIITPYFILRDLRIYSAHKKCKVELSDILKRLLLDKSDVNDFELIYKTLLKKIIEFHNEVLVWGIKKVD